MSLFCRCFIKRIIVITQFSKLYIIQEKNDFKKYRNMHWYPIYYDVDEISGRTGMERR
jgi:hypothetical protein